MYAFRWRTEKEVVDGTGQFTCGNKHCKKFVKKGLDELSSFEVMFNYKERGEKKSALVKIRVCEKCVGWFSMPENDLEKYQTAPNIYQCMAFICKKLEQNQYLGLLT